VQPAGHLIKVPSPVINHKKYQRQVKHIIIMNMKKHIINHRKQLIEMDGREEIPLERETISLINQLLKRATIYR
jgi:hypothetical protein